MRVAEELHYLKLFFQLSDNLYEGYGTEMNAEKMSRTIGGNAFRG